MRDTGRPGPAWASFREAREGIFGASLDSNGKSTCGQGAQGVANDAEGARRTYDRYRLQRHAAKVLNWPKALAACEYARQHRAQSVEVWRNSAAERGAWTRFVGLQTCKSVWACPVCSNRCAWRRREDLQRLVEYAGREGMTLAMLTLTSRHDLTTGLQDQRDMMAEAKSRMAALAPFKRGLGRHMRGSVTATEVTHGERTGWHLHFHYIVMLDLRHLPPDEREDAAAAMGADAWPAWQRAAERAGLHAVRAAYSVEVGAAVAAYPGDVGKIQRQWTLADEATRGAAKGGAGRHPFELLRLSCDENDSRARALFVEYAGAMKGARALVWSRGLAALVGVGADDETEGGECQDGTGIMREKAGDLEPDDWRGRDGRRGVRARRGRMSVAVARDGAAGLERERDNDRSDPTAAQLEAAAAAAGEGAVIEPDPGMLVEDERLSFASGASLLEALGVSAMLPDRFHLWTEREIGLVRLFPGDGSG